jgi:glycine C-acetyltransferase
MNPAFTAQLESQLAHLHQSGLFKPERIIYSPQSTHIALSDGQAALNFCANNYLGLADDPRLVLAAKKGLDGYGYGVASVRFICGTQMVHKTLERHLANFLAVDDCILFSSCFDANGGVFETLLTEADAVISDELNHASIIDGIRLCKAQRYRYKNNDMTDLEQQLQTAKQAGARYCLIVTDGVFSMDGIIANVAGICDLAEKYQALVMVDDSHAVGLLGPNGRGSPEYCGVAEKIDIYSGTLGKALGGASGYIAGSQAIIDWLRQRARPYLFSNSLPPAVVAGSIQAIEIIKTEGHGLRQRLHHNAQQFRLAMTQAGFDLIAGEHPIIPVMLGDAQLAANLATALLADGIYVIGFSFPVVPMGKARIRTQISAGHTPQQIEQAVAAFSRAGKRLGVI